MGVVLSKYDIWVAKTIVQAFKSFREPENDSEIKSFLGLVHFNARFLPKVASVAEHLRKLLEKIRVSFKWDLLEKIRVSFKWDSDQPKKKNDCLKEMMSNGIFQ